MTGETNALRTLTLLVAVCEQTITALEALDPPDGGRVLEAAKCARQLASDEIRGTRLRNAEQPGM